MTDTVAILNTIRATFADSDPTKFDINDWYSERAKCGCIIGHSMTMQPLLARELGLSVRRNQLLQSGVGALYFTQELANAGIRLAALFGISEHEACFLFDWAQYGRGLKRGPKGHREALRRLDEVISRYSTQAVAGQPALVPA